MRSTGQRQLRAVDGIQGPGDRVITILLRTILAEQGGIRQELDSLPAKIKELRKYRVASPRAQAAGSSVTR